MLNIALEDDGMHCVTWFRLHSLYTELGRERHETASCGRFTLLACGPTARVSSVPVCVVLSGAVSPCVARVCSKPFVC